jgi:hypothetical protein
LNLEVFCYLGLLRFPEQLEPSLALLPEEQKTEAKKILASLQTLPRKEVLRRWFKVRQDEREAMSRNAYERSGIRLDELSPTLRDWCVSRLGDRNG